MEPANESYGDRRGVPFLETLGQDLRYGLRALRRNPSFSLMAILTLALGIGAATMTFSLIDSIVLNTFPYRNADRLATIDVHELKKSGYNGPPEFTVPEFLEFRNSSRAFEDVIGFRNTSLLYRNGQGTQRVEAAWVTTNTFPFLGVPPLFGRPVLPEDEKPGAPAICVISDRFWHEQFHGDPKALGATLDLDGELRTVVGIMPPRFQFQDVPIWMPYSLSGGGVSSGPGKQPARVGAIGRLRPGASVQAAATDFETIVRRLAAEYPRDYPDLRFTISVRTLKDRAVGGVKRVLYTLFAAVTMLLLIACGNVANLLLARATVRAREITIRACIGASRGRLVRQLLVESWILAAAGGMAGWLLADAGLSGYAALLPAGAIPHEAVIGLNRTALWFALGATLVTTLLCGLAPALHVVRDHGNRPLALAATGASEGPGLGKLRSALVIGEVALSLVLLVGAGLMMRTFFAITHVDLGFNPANVLHARLALPKGRYIAAWQQKKLFQQTLDRIRRLPGVTTAALTLEVPGLDGGPVVELDVPGKAHPEPWHAMIQVCSEGYFQALGRSLKRGRIFSEADIDSARHAAVANETFARAFLGNENPLGRKIRFKFDRMLDAPSDPDFEVIGIVSDAKNRGLREPVMPQVYLPYTAFPLPGNGILVKTAVQPLSLVESIRRQIWTVDPDVVMTGNGTVEKSISESAYAEPRFGLVSIGGFAGIGFVLVAVGVFSVMAYSVSVRTREIGIRMALGAQPGRILGMMLRKGLTLIAAGIFIGLLASLSLTRLVASQLWGVSATDPWTFVAVSVILAASGLTACLLPARRAAKVDPMLALRCE